MRLHGELDIARLPVLTAVLRGSCRQTRDAWLIVDLRAVTFIDTATVRELKGAQEHCERAGHGLRLVYDQLFIATILDLLDAAPRFPRYATADDARAGREAPRLPGGRRDHR
ncbi:STAS domain-containing protein [Streptomyces sp. NPDC088785]|uniref:STAS domain-containing protein n=1 Tax=Streptomyces sp. NPDC088785 TaxID=3365897 RepID=UPI003820C3CE